MSRLDRRAVLLGGTASMLTGALGACVPAQGPVASAPVPSVPVLEDEPVGGIYGPVTNEPFPIPPAPLSKINPAFLRTRVAYATTEPPGTLIVEPARHYLFEVLDGGQANRYGIGVGREGFGWSGTATVKDKQAWPDWYPPKEMIQRRPDIRKDLSELQGGLGMAGGPRNPLGARAMYLWQNNKDTLYRIHGTVEPQTIGTNVSSGCIRMINQDVIDLYSRVPVGAKVIVLA